MSSFVDSVIETFPLPPKFPVQTVLLLLFIRYNLKNNKKTNGVRGI